VSQKDQKVALFCCRRTNVDDEDEDGRRGVSFRDHGQADEARRPSPTDQSRRPTLMSFPSLEHLDGSSPWKSTTRRRRKFRGGIGGLQRGRRGEGNATDPGPANSDDDDDVELDRVDAADVDEAVPDTSRKASRTASKVRCFIY